MSNAHRARSNNLTLVQGGLNKMVSSETLQPMGVAALSPPLRNTLAASTAIAAATHQVSLRFRLHFPKVQTPPSAEPGARAA